MGLRHGWLGPDRCIPLTRRCRFSVSAQLFGRRVPANGNVRLQFLQYPRAANGLLHTGICYAPAAFKAIVDFLDSGCNTKEPEAPDAVEWQANFRTVLVSTKSEGPILAKLLESRGITVLLSRLRDGTIELRVPEGLVTEAQEIITGPRQP
jgi:hypothetical protein